MSKSTSRERGWCRELPPPREHAELRALTPLPKHLFSDNLSLPARASAILDGSVPFAGFCNKQDSMQPCPELRQQGPGPGVSHYPLLPQKLLCQERHTLCQPLLDKAVVDSGQPLKCPWGLEGVVQDGKGEGGSQEAPGDFLSSHTHHQPAMCAEGLAKAQAPGLELAAGGDEKNCSDCICVKSEFHCGDPGCQTCTHHPCPPGQEAVPEGNFKFGFRCVDCAVGTFSSGHEGRCRPWTDCDQFGFLTMFHGNKTHNAVCILGSLPAEPPGQLTILLLALATCILVLTTAQLSLHIWQLRRKHRWPQETPPLPEVLPPPAEDACSCQFPEEERGERLEKDELGRPWV
ncbi:TNF receptor superfamily member 18 [Ictidomys tridecemlineatus]|nr:TNF receptor superfamily member 18 [Ictidomys tridecemlineatus]